MNTVERLLNLAILYAEAAVHADRARNTARSADGLTEQAAALTAVRHADDTLDRSRAALHIDLRHVLERPVRAVPDAELPVCTWHNNQVEVRALTVTEGRAVRVRYTPAQALAAGAALIACAALADQRLDGTLASILGAFPPGAEQVAGPDTPWFESPA